MLNINLMRFEQRQNKPHVWDVRYGANSQILATITESLNSGSKPTHTVQFYRHIGDHSGPVVVPTREEAVRHIQKYFSGELDRFVDDEP